MTAVALKERFMELLPTPKPNDWEVEESLLQLRNLAPEQQELVLDQVPAIWPVSNSLCYSFLRYAGPALDCLGRDQVSSWVAAILDIYEDKGLHQAQLFMADAENNYLCRLRGQTGIELAALPQLRTYAQGVAGQPVRLAPDHQVWTDTETIYLPAKISRFANSAENSLYYKLLLTFQAGLVRTSSLRLSFAPGSILIGNIREVYGLGAKPAKTLNLTGFFDLFPLPALVADLYSLAESWRLRNWLAENFSGLWRESKILREKLLADQPAPEAPDSRRAIVDNLCNLIRTGSSYEKMFPDDERFQACAKQFFETSDNPKDSAIKAAAVYALINGLPETYQHRPSIPWIGRLHFDEAWRILLRKREASRERFIKDMAVALASSQGLTEPTEPVDEYASAPLNPETQSATALLIPPGKKDSKEKSPGHHQEPRELLTLGGITFEIPESLRQQAAEIRQDLGYLPAEYISAAQGLAGQGTPNLTLSSAGEGEKLAAPIIYDEWDFRRHGFRRDWCMVNERELQPVRSSLVERTLEKYRGQVRMLRKQFEMMRTSDRFLKRQGDGDDIDLDALIESLSNRRAGRAGSEHLFIRLNRDERDIAVLFLVDMSSSTEGWINRALQEALILIGEALQTIGDRFAITGFSGMRRTRSDIYLVKDFNERYSEEVKGKIAAMAPKEYTRMGPALRHAGRLLQGVEARSRLLIVLSDGKPEDYDDYKGKYAIEDTRHALIEAKAAGIHPFCITIDRQAHDYMPHMYGEVNYIFLDDVRQLPLRLPAIYRNLTT